ncbi:hypothetical protein RO575_00235 [Methylomonas sp. MO1]|uniref:hypothetical protein n=1 Tax=unclassified Methylomonas TaxID=2608980 RepID=UPI00047D5F17|nr:MULTISPECIES: hypothetical protein [unclassified Methylomonas]MDT4287979.1 hypothetical protein [Methylomonas sp. MO1]
MTSQYKTLAEYLSVISLITLLFVSWNVSAEMIISDMNPEKASPGQTVNITGQGFPEKDKLEIHLKKSSGPDKKLTFDINPTKDIITVNIPSDNEIVAGTYSLELKDTTNNVTTKTPKNLLIERYEEITISDLKPDRAPRGGAIKIIGKGFPTDKSKIKVSLKLSSGDKELNVDRVDTSSNSTEQIIAVNIPSDNTIIAGKYSLSLTFNGAGGEYSVPKDLTVYPPVTGDRTPTITGVYPTVVYPEENTGTYSITISGENFSSYGFDNKIHRYDSSGKSLGEIQVACWNNKTKDGKVCIEEQIKGEIDGDSLKISNLPKQDNNVGNQIQLKIADKESSRSTQKITFASRSKDFPKQVAVTAAIVFFAILLFVYFVTKAKKGTQIAGEDNKSSFFGRLFIEPETNTYSLSRMQFYIWTGVGVFGYAYLAGSKWLVQGLWTTLVEVPQNLPGVILISTLTGIGGLHLQESQAKGAGPEKPSLGDFFMTGGVIAPERVQFVVWTVVAVIGFITQLLATDPGIITDLPKIPDGFLELMGISSFGYLGGRFIRKPGPILEKITSSSSGSDFKVVLEGKNLPIPENATFKLGNKTLTIKPDQFSDLKPQDQGSKLLKALTITIKKGDKDWVSGGDFTIINSDGAQESTLKLNVIDITDITPNSVSQNSTTTLAVAGENFLEGIKASFEMPVGNVAKDFKSEVTFTDSKSLKISLTTPSVTNTAKATLILTNPGGSVARKEFEVK